MYIETWMQDVCLIINNEKHEQGLLIFQSGTSLVKFVNSNVSFEIQSIFNSTFLFEDVYAGIRIFTY